MWALGTLRTVRTWIGLVVTAVGTLALTLPFLLPYTQAQEQFGFARPLSEVVRFSANVWSYVTASENLWLFGQTLRYYPHGEGETFLGFVPWILAAIAILALVWGSDHERKGPPGLATPKWRRALLWLLVIAVVTQLIGMVSAVIVGGFDINVLGVPIRARSPQRLIWQFVGAAVLLLACSSRTRSVAARAAQSSVVLFAVGLVLALWLSLGPQPRAGDALTGFGLYGVLFNYVPGFNGVRVPARYAMLAGLFLAVLAGYGMAALIRLTRRAGTPAVASLIGLAILIEGAAIPMEMNRTWAQGEATPPARVYPASQAPPVYASVAALPAGSAITEFPFGDAAWEIRYVYYAAAHWQPITNGYSGGFPPDYQARVARLQKVSTNPEASWQSLVDSGSTHVVLHTNAFAVPADAEVIRAWLTAHDAKLLEQFPDGDTLFALP